MDISKIDKNFVIEQVDRTDLEWHEITESAFSVHGVFFDEAADCYVRMPQEIAQTVSEGVHYLSRQTAGGRVRFATDSPYVAIRCTAPVDFPMHHMTLTGSRGVALYADNVFHGSFIFGGDVLINAHRKGAETLTFDSIRDFKDEKLRECSLYLPLYGSVKKLLVGLKKGCILQAAKPYTHSRPVVFYGSSITQGGCASQSGNDYISHLSRWLDFDFINLGFSGNAKAEPQIAEYLAGLNASVFVLDYDHNAPDLAHLEKTHFPLYARIRKSHANAPVVLMTKPDFDRDPVLNAKCRSVVYDTYYKAKAQGDENIYFIDGETLFGSFDRHACTVDTCHPNDLGFYRMAQTVRPVLEKIFQKLD